MGLRVTVAGLLSVAVVVVAGCGSGGPTSPGGGSPGPGQTVSYGPLQVTVASAAGFETLSINTNPVAFVAMYGSRIVRAQESHFEEKMLVVLGPSYHWRTCLISPNGEGVAELWNGTQWGSWSPDGSRIVYHIPVQGSPGTIGVANSDGTGKQTIGSGLWPAWSPNGDKIAFLSGGYLCLMDPDGTDVQQLVQADSGPSWSPNGQELVYAKGAGLFVTDRSGHGYWAIPTGLSAASVSEPDWSPDGKTIVFWALEGIYHYVYTVRIDGTALAKLTATDGYRRYPIWSPNGNRIAFKDGYDVVTVRPNGRDLRRLTYTGGGVSDWTAKALVRRTLIGPAGSEYGTDPPLGSGAPVVVAGIKSTGLASAIAVVAPEASWPTVQVEQHQRFGKVVGLKITGSALSGLSEDMGLGNAPRIWDFSGTPDVGAILVYLSSQTGGVSSSIAVGDQAMAAEETAGLPTTEQTGDGVVLRGTFVGALNASDPERNLVRSPAHRLTLDRETGAVTVAN